LQLPFTGTGVDKNVSLFSVELVTSAASADEALAGVVEEFVLVVDGVAVILIGAYVGESISDSVKYIGSTVPEGSFSAQEL